MQKFIFVPCKCNILSLTWNSQINSIQWCYVLASRYSSTNDSSLLQTDQQSIMYENLNRQLYSSRLSTYCSEPISYGLNCLPCGPNDLVNRSDDSQCSDTEKIISLSNSLKECSKQSTNLHNTYYLWSQYKYCWLRRFLLSASDLKILVQPAF